MESLSKLNYLNVGRHGTFSASGNSAYDSSPADVDALFRYLNDQGKDHIVLNFHGGLVGDNAGMRSAEVFTVAVKELTHIHPVSFVWETGPFETIFQNIDTLAKTPFFKKILEKVLKVAGEKLGVDLEGLGGKRGVANLSYDEIKAELNKDFPFEHVSEDANKRSATVSVGNERFLKAEIEEDIRTEIEADRGINDSLLDSLSDDELDLLDIEKVIDEDQPGGRGFVAAAKLIKTAASVAFRVVKRYLEKRDHGFYPTIMEELMRALLVDKAGVWVWGAMKEKAEAMWKQDGPGTADMEKHVGNYFLEKLKEYSAQRKVTLDLVGHSAGSIVICYLMKELHTRALNVEVKNIVFMAPACRSDLFVSNIVDNELSSKSFRMFTMKDEWEVKDRCVPVIYTRSLLYMISGILEKDEYDAYILGMQRYHLDEKPYESDPVLDKVREFLQAAENCTVYSVTAETALDGLRSAAVKHGAFNDKDEITLTSIAYLLKQV